MRGQEGMMVLTGTPSRWIDFRAEGDSEATEKISWVPFFQAVLVSRNKILSLWSPLPPIVEGELLIGNWVKS